MPLIVPLFLLAAADLPVKPVCQDAEVRHVGSTGPARPHALGKEPPAQVIYTVLRSEGGCSRPVPVNARRIGSPVPRR